MELVECKASVAECKLKLAEHNRRLADYEKSNKSTSGFGDTIAIELMIFHLVYCLALVLLWLIGFWTVCMVDEVTTTKMEQSKELDVSATNAEVSLRVTTKDPKKVAAGKKLADWNHKNTE